MTWKRRRDQGVAAEAEDDAVSCATGRSRPKLDQARIEGQVGIGEQPGDPVADEQPEHRPDHGEDDADLARIVVVVLEALLGRLGQIVSRDNGECPDQRGQDDQGAVPADDVIPSDCSDEKAYGGKADQDEKGDRRSPSVSCPIIA